MTRGQQFQNAIELRRLPQIFFYTFVVNKLVVGGDSIMSFTSLFPPNVFYLRPSNSIFLEFLLLSKNSGGRQLR